jgi:hypothetical protein
MVIDIEQAEENTLVLIEEIENGLHPAAAVRLVEYLIEVAERKKIQVIFTTHSNDALRILPTKAVWVATKDKIFQGKLDVKSLRSITGQVESSAVVFVEDGFAKTWVEALLRQGSGVDIEHVEVHAMEGDGTAVAVNKHHNQDPSVKVKSVCYIDGDSQQQESKEEGVYRLPGEVPESYIFDEVISSWASTGGKLCVALLQRFEDAEKVKVLCEETRNTNHDAHLLFSQVAERLGFLPASTVINAFTNIWAQNNRQMVQDLIAPIAMNVKQFENEVGR